MVHVNWNYKKGWNVKEALIVGQSFNSFDIRMIHELLNYKNVITQELFAEVMTGATKSIGIQSKFTLIVIIFSAVKIFVNLLN